MRRITAVEDDRMPLCASCEQELLSVSYRRIDSGLGVRYLYYCPHCRKALGVTHRKRFWMG